ncbi:hypothetical protein [Nonomuraea dietziae]|uniref:Uncharacterized protein n=1 Tax=Nonomuraea dietziae TaxID=65515 RepID=A0A7W5YKL2_9ACTN|nr:hypothetical protein [Nonomuraea dietziae]MBB3724207.1 hypothetical protein [Nonomuraea dietziae]
MDERVGAVVTAGLNAVALSAAALARQPAADRREAVTAAVAALPGLGRCGWPTATACTG